MPEVHPPVPNNAEFGVGARWQAPSGYTLHFTHEGNLERRSPAGSMLWESRTAGRGAGKLAMQADGNLVIYDPSLAKAPGPPARTAIAAHSLRCRKTETS